jgi:hypothetical protein
MLPSIEYATLLQYSPDGDSEASQGSRRWRDAVKGGRIEAMRRGVAAIVAGHQQALEPFLNEHVTLVPMPRSSPIRTGDLWPTLELANMLAGLGLGTVAPCLERQSPVRKSALHSKADDRPSVGEHYDSFAVDGQVTTPSITLVDDVLTLGRTAMAAASRLAEAFPDSTIRLFCLMRAKGLEKEIDSIVHVRVEAITYNAKTKKTRLNP